MEIVRDYLYSYIHFQTLYEKYKTHTLTFDDVEEFVTDKDPTVPLFNLKESCHMLFRYQEEEHCSDEEKLLDLAVGSIFHEAMKLRENLYQLEVYKPRYLQIQDSKETSDYERNLLQEFIKIGARTEKRLAESVKETKRLLRDTLNQLAHLLPRYKNNHALMRFLLRNKEFMQQAFGQRKGLKIIADMFPGGLAEAYAREGQGYLRVNTTIWPQNFLNMPSPIGRMIKVSRATISMPAAWMVFTRTATPAPCGHSTNSFP